MRWDDPIGAVAVHGFCGIWGTLSLGLFACGKYGATGPFAPDNSAPLKGLFYGGGLQVLTAQFLGSAIYYGFLPALTIVLSSVGGWMLGMRNMMVSTLSEDYILTAEAKGLKPSRVRMTYAARNAVLPSLSGFAISLGFVVAGSIVTEEVFSYPGIGQLLWTAVSNDDYALMQGIFLVISVSVLVANLVVDFLYALIDPRTRVRA